MSSENRPLRGGEQPQIYSSPHTGPRIMTLNNLPPPPHSNGQYAPQGSYPNQGYYSSPPQYQQAPYPHYPQPTYMMAQEIVPAVPAMDRKEQTVTCWYCNRVVQTRIEHKAGTCTWLGCTSICLMGGCFGCCLIPFCVNRCQDVYHYCGNCNSRLGINTAL